MTRKHGIAGGPELTRKSGSVNGFLHLLATFGHTMALGFGAGMKKARLATGLRLNRTVSQDLMAELITAELKRTGEGDRSISQSAWSQYESEGSEPPLVIVRAASRLSGIPEAEILFPSPVEPIDVSELRYLTEEEHERADRKVAERTPDPAATKKSGRALGKGVRKPPA